MTTCPVAAENIEDNLLLKNECWVFKVQWLHFAGEQKKQNCLLRIMCSKHYSDQFIFDWHV